MPKDTIRSFSDFWPQYVRQHLQRRTRLFHAAGSILSVVLAALAFGFHVAFLILVPLVGYGLAWYSHFYVEHNRPATFSHPFYSLMADYRMLFLMMAGRMDDEVAKYIAGVSPAAAHVVV